MRLKAKVWLLLAVSVLIYFYYAAFLAPIYHYGYFLKAKIVILGADGKQLKNISLKVRREHRHSDLKSRILTWIDGKERMELVEWATVSSFNSGDIFEEMLYTPDPVAPVAVQLQFDKLGMKNQILRIPWQKTFTEDAVQSLSVTLEAN